ncbi:MAG: hypothetical protein IT361_10985 [Gemmatimonadaceae bacterium]|nr:hypothetical protein [Gemmatimonadaceae bacterium]
MLERKQVAPPSMVSPDDLKDMDEAIDGAAPWRHPWRQNLRLFIVSGVLNAAATFGLRALAAGDTSQVVWVDVRDATSLGPLEGARVRSLQDSLVRTVTDERGMAAIALRSTARTLVTTRLGYAPDTTRLSDGAWAAGVVTIALARNAQPLAALRVEHPDARRNAMMMEFEQRRARRAGGASFIGPADIERSPHSRLTDLLRRGILGIELVDSGGVLLPVSSRGAVLRLNQDRPTATQRAQGRQAGTMERVLCTLRIVVDGSAKEWGFDLTTIDRNEVYGIEIYAGPATLPAQYASMGRDGFCGLVMIWTRPR